MHQQLAHPACQPRITQSRVQLLMQKIVV